MSSRAGGLYGGIQFSSSKAFATPHGPAVSSATPAADKPAFAATPVDQTTSTQNVPAPASSAAGAPVEPSAAAKATAGTPPSPIA
ncbi:hypothetical protein BC628DRAFT_545666 [Trametes gibbosa]|nr:hypothetical protein BC628DRAFT_545666 [Trametes gibbosa]